MALFVYSGRTRSGERVEGTVEAPDRRMAILSIERRGHIPISIRDGAAAAGTHPDPASVALSPPGSGLRMRGRDVLLFTTELSDLLSSGMTLGNALNALARRQSRPAAAAIIADLRDQIVRGSSLSDALARHPKTFSRLYISMIQAGEASGALGEVLRRLVAHYERVQETKDKVTMALVYPSIVLMLGLVTLVFSLVKVIPTFASVFHNLRASLPLPTRLLIGVSTGLLRYGWLVLLAVMALVLLSWRALQTERGRMARDRMLLRIPLVRGMVASSVYAHFAHTLETLLANGVPVLSALTILERTVTNTVIAREIRHARDRVTDGTSISGPLAAGGVFPGTLTDMLAIGEQTGDMCTALAHVARRYEAELDRTLKIFTTALEPILIVVVAVLVGFVAVSILMAVFRLTSGLGML